MPAFTNSGVQHEEICLSHRSFRMLLPMPLDALASDTAVISAHYGRKLDGIFGYSCLSDKIVLIDYPHQTLGILDHTNDAAPMVEVYSFPAARALQLSTAEMV
jgi:hypothetical protein